MRSLFVAFFSVVLAAFAAGNAKLSPWEGDFVLDGKLNEVGWQKAETHSDFKPTSAKGQKTVEVGTWFKMCGDADYLYVGVDCVEPRMAELDRKGGIWISDGVEFFFCPTGKGNEYYQFRVNAVGPVFSMYYAEGGAIRPDPYAPFWEHAVDLRKDGWSIEMRIPWRAFYMTSTQAWSQTWRLNVARNRRVARQDMSWAQLVDDFHETKLFPLMDGFPKKRPEEEVWIKGAVLSAEAMKDGVCKGTLAVEISTLQEGKYTLKCQGIGDKAKPVQAVLKSGVNSLSIPEAEFKSTGRNQISMVLEKAGKVVGERYYTVVVQFTPVKVRLSRPEYRNTFYPGQDSGVIAGEIEVMLPDVKAVELKFDGKAAGRLNVVNGKASFSFKTKELADGKHTLFLTLPGKETENTNIPIYKYSKNDTGHTGAWIENGWLVVDGKPKLPRLIYAHYYHGGKALDEKTETDDLGLSGKDRLLRKVNEPKRLIADIEYREATRDVKPCQQMYDVMRAFIEKNRNADFEYYYFSDEPECREVSPVYLKHLYEFVKELDPWHPMMITSRAPARYLDCADILVPHPYTGPMLDGKGGRFLNVPIQRVRNYVTQITSTGRKDKVAGIMSQFFSYKGNSVYADYPTFEELESQTWSCVANGAHFIYPYAYHDLGDRPVIYEGLRYVMTSLRALEPITLLGNTIKLNCNLPDTCDAAMLERNGKYLFIVVNLLPTAQKLSIDDAQLKKIKQWHLFRAEGAKLEGGKSKYAFELKPYECIVATSESVGDELLSRKAVLDKIAQLDKERLSRPNLLLENGLRIEISSSNQPRTTLGMRNKLFDGTRDVYAWSNADNYSKADTFIDMSFVQKLVPEFRKLRIYGYPLDEKVQVSIRKRGEWKKLTPVSVKKEKYMVEYDFGEKSRTVRMRLDFPKKNTPLELYEIELEP